MLSKRLYILLIQHPDESIRLKISIIKCGKYACYEINLHKSNIAIDEKKLFVNISTCREQETNFKNKKNKNQEHNILVIAGGQGVREYTGIKVLTRFRC